MNDNNLLQLFNLLDTLPNPVTLNELAYDDEGNSYDKIIYTNQSFLKHIGYSIEDIPDDRTWFAKAYPEESYQQYITAEWFKAVAKAKEEGTDLTGFPAKVHCKDGEYRWFNITTQLEHTINERYRTIVFVQSEEPSEVQLKLDEKSMLLKTIINSAPIRIFWKDTKGVYLGCNKAFLEDAHLNDEREIIGTTDYDHVWRVDAERFRADDRRVCESGTAKLNYIEEQPREDGKRRIISTSKVPLKESTGEIIGVLGIYQDITKEYEATTAFKEQEKLLHFQSRQAAMGEMIAMIAHQWKQPLSSIAAMASTMKIQQMLGTPSQECVNEQSDLILDQIEYLSHTITDFRNFFKQEKVIKQLQAEDAINDALRIIGKLLDNSGIELRTSYASTREFRTYPKELQHVFINLIKNAADILIEKVKTDRWIEISSRDENDFVVFEVSDNGGGVQAGMIERIFEPYVTTKDEQDGTGLGLYMSQTIIENHLKGSICCENVQEGALFTVRLPIDFTKES